MQTLPFVLFIIMTEVSIGSVALLVALDWRNEVKRGFLISYSFIYLFLTGLTYLVQQNFATPELLNTYPQLDHAWTSSLPLPLLLFFLLMIPYTVLLLLDRRAGVEGVKYAQKDAALEAKEAEEASRAARPPRPSRLRILRLLTGGLILLAGLATLLVLGMIFRPLASANAAGFFTVAGFFAAALALGGVLTAMWLGHWYLVTPALSEKPLQFATTVVLLGVLLQAILAMAAGSSTIQANAPKSAQTSGATTVTAATPTPVPAKNVKPAGAPVITPLSADAIGWIRILVSFVMPLILGGIAWKLIRDRSFQSATGMLYLVVVITLAGEGMARGLFLLGL